MDWLLYDSDPRHERVNNVIDSFIFKAALKLVHITPIFYKKCSKNTKENYRPVSILPNISKIYERCMYKPILVYFANFFSECQCGL